MEPIETVFLVALAAGTATGLGAIPIFFTDRISHRTYDGSMALAAGIMFGAAVFALILPGMEIGPMSEVMIGILVGGVGLLVANQFIPHINVEAVGEEELNDRGLLEEPIESRRKALLIGGAVTIHNIPEGLAVGIAFGSGLEGVGLVLALAIAIQNIPDGFAIAVPAKRSGVSRLKTLAYTTVSGGIPEPVAAVLGFVLVAYVTDLFPIAAGIAAGAMMAVIFREMIPSSHGHGYADISTLTFVFGFVLMMFVDNVFAV